MWNCFSCFLIALGVLAATFGCSFYLRSNKNSKTRIHMLWYGLSAGVWCICYGLMGVCGSLELAGKIRYAGVVAVDSFIAADLFLLIEVVDIKKSIATVEKILMVIACASDAFFFSNPNVDKMVFRGNWITWYAADGVFGRYYHSGAVMFCFALMLITGLAWAYTNQLRRQKKFIQLAFACNFILMFFTLPDTFLVMLDHFAVPTSGIGAAVCTFVMWYGAEKLDAFNIEMGNISKNIYDFVDSGICVFSLDNHLELYNPYAGKILAEGYLLGKSFRDIFEVTEQEEKEIFDSEEGDHARRLKARETDYICSVRCTSAKDEYGDPYCYIAAFYDISEEIRMVDELEVANNTKSDFLASVSHEVRTPINAVLGFGEMILREADDPEILLYAENIQIAGRTLLASINDILDMSKVEAGRMEILPVEYSLARMIHDSYLLVANRADGKGLYVEIENNVDIPSTLFGDDMRIRQIITNLLTNAVKYTEHGGIIFKVDYEPVANEYIRLVISVKDTGVGIKEEDLPHIFDMFKRTGDVKNQHIEGTGVGLSITKNLVELMNGTITVSSEFGAGSEFVVKLPQQVIHWNGVGKISKNYQPENTENTEFTSFEAEDARVLAVDDSEVNLMVLVGLLKKTKIKVDKAKSGEVALDMIGRKKYDIIFLDHMMPQMDGAEVLGRMREDKKHPNQETPVIVLTANAMVGAKNDYLAMGFTDYLAKPIDPILLEKILRKYLDSELIKETVQPEQEMEDSDFPYIDGINWESAFRNVPTPELLKDVIREFCASADRDVTEMEGHFDAVRNNGDKDSFEGYRIKVHAMKNSAALIGADDLSAEAYALEMAARAGETETILDGHEAFLKHYAGITDRIRNTFDGEKGAEQKIAVDKETLFANLDALNMAMEDFDTDALMSMSINMRNQIFDDNISGLIEKVCNAARDLDAKALSRATEEIRSIIG